MTCVVSGNHGTGPVNVENIKYELLNSSVSFDTIN
jgi:hypothetical protein